MKISHAKVIVCCPSRKVVTLKIETDLWQRLYEGACLAPRAGDAVCKPGGERNALLSVPCGLGVR